MSQCIFSCFWRFLRGPTEVKTTYLADLWPVLNIRFNWGTGRCLQYLLRHICGLLWICQKGQVGRWAILFQWQWDRSRSLMLIMSDSLSLTRRYHELQRVAQLLDFRLPSPLKSPHLSILTLRVSIWSHHSVSSSQRTSPSPSWPAQGVYN